MSWDVVPLGIISVGGQSLASVNTSSIATKAWWTRPRDAKQQNRHCQETNSELSVYHAHLKQPIESSNISANIAECLQFLQVSAFEVTQLWYVILSHVHWLFLHVMN